MPLSQGYCLKPSLRAMKVLRQEQQQQQQMQQDQNRGHHQPPNSRPLQCYLSHGENQSSLHYLLAESFVKVGSLAQAFDVYELIASRQFDGHVPLDKLNSLASALTSQIRQMGGITTSTNTTSTYICMCGSASERKK